MSDWNIMFNDRAIRFRGARGVLLFVLALPAFAIVGFGVVVVWLVMLLALVLGAPAWALADALGATEPDPSPDSPEG